MTDPLDWNEWFKRNPMPQLSKLVKEYGGYDKIPEEAWKQYRAHCKLWEDARKNRMFGGG